MKLKHQKMMRKDNIISKTLKGSRDKSFHSYNYKCIYDINFTNIRKNKKSIAKLKNIVWWTLKRQNLLDTIVLFLIR